MSITSAVDISTQAVSPAVDLRRAARAPGPPAAGGGAGAAGAVWRKAAGTLTSAMAHSKSVHRDGLTAPSHVRRCPPWIAAQSALSSRSPVRMRTAVSTG